jgi:hypothetical protein
VLYKTRVHFTILSAIVGDVSIGCLIFSIYLQVFIRHFHLLSYPCLDGK